MPIEVKKHVPPPVETTYDLIGITAKQFKVIRKALYAYRCAAENLQEAFQVPKDSDSVIAAALWRELHDKQ